MKTTPAERVLAALIVDLVAQYRYANDSIHEVDRWRARGLAWALADLRRLMQKEGML